MATPQVVAAGTTVQVRKVALLVILVIQGFIYGVICVHIAKPSMVAVYYILTQWLHGQQIAGVHVWNVKFVWDHLFSADYRHGWLAHWMSANDWNTKRHIILPYLEGLFAILLWLQLNFNSNH